MFYSYCSLASNVWPVPLPYGSAPAGTQLSERLAFKRQFARSPKALDLEHADVASLILHE